MSASIGEKYKFNSQNNIQEDVKQKQLNYSLENSKIMEQSEQNNMSRLNPEDKKQLMTNQVKSDESKNNGEDVDDQSGKLHEKIVIQILNQKGLVGQESINKGSIHSSAKSSGSYGGNFLKEIITMEKVPRQSYQYSFLLIFFIVVFICLNFTNLMIIKSDMQFFTDNVDVLRQPRNFLRAYAKTLYGRIIKYELNYDIMHDKDGSLMDLAEFYIYDGLDEYYNLIQEYQRVITQYCLQLQGTFKDENKTRTVEVFQDQANFQQVIDFSLTFRAQNNQTERKQIDSYLYLRQNFFQFSSDILDFGVYLVNNALTTVDNLINKFTIIAIAAIIGVILVSLISLPILRLINLYEEKIMMIVSRINYDQSQIEKMKLGVSQQLIDLEQTDWLKFNFNDIISLKFDQFDANVVNSQHDLTRISSTKKGEKINALNFTKKSQENKNQNLNELKYTNYMKDGSDLNFKSKIKKSNKVFAFDDANSSYKDYKISMKNQINKNYLLQSKIINQKLSIFKRFIPLFILTLFNTLYFLIIIIYLQQSNETLKVPVEFNKRTIQYHIAQTTLKISAEFLTFNFLIDFKALKKVLPINLEGYQVKMDKMIQMSIENSSVSTELVYSDNPFPSEILSKFKDFEEGKICQYLVKYSCVQSETQNLYSYNYLLQEKLRVIFSYPQVITKYDAPIELLGDFADSNDHIVVFVKSFLIEDEAIDLYSTASNDSIKIMSGQVQKFLEQYLLIFGNLFGLTIIIVCIFNWRSLYQRMQLMNLLLTMIPEEKLLEEVTLQMLKTLCRM